MFIFTTSSKSNKVLQKTVKAMLIYFKIKVYMNMGVKDKIKQIIPQLNLKFHR